MCKDAGDDAKQQKWRINKDNQGLANVVVFLKPDGETFFACSADDPGVKAVKDHVFELDQPYCAFEPHIGIFFPEYKDKDNKKHKTDETMKARNNSDKAPGGKPGGIAHNTKWLDQNPLVGPGESKGITGLSPNLQSPVTFSCSIHTWMDAAVWVLDHPYYAKTDKDGKFEIKNVPTGVKVRIVAWHEVPGIINGDGKGEVIELKADETKKMELKAKK